jgi:hypothetical protein
MQHVEKLPSVFAIELKPFFKARASWASSVYENHVRKKKRRKLQWGKQRLIGNTLRFRRVKVLFGCEKNYRYE